MSALAVYCMLANMEQGPLQCSVKACHSCRPYYRDRVWISFQAVINADFPPISREDIDVLPTKSAQVLQTIGNVKHIIQTLSSESAGISLPTFTSLVTSTDAPPTASTTTSTSSDLTFKTTQTDLDVIQGQHYPRRNFYKQGHRSAGDIARTLSRRRSTLIRPGLRSALQGIFHPSRASSSAGSNITLPVSRTETARSSSEVEDVEGSSAPRKVQGENQRLELQTGSLAFEDMLANGNKHTFSSPDSDVDCQDDELQDSNTSSFDSLFYSDASDGSEVEVEVGAALKEGAVERHTPDVSRVGVSALKGATIVHDMEMSDDADDEADIGLQSIMAHV